MVNYLARVLLSAVLATGVVLVGCSSQLTESSAVRLLQRYYDEQNKRDPNSNLNFVVESCTRLVLANEVSATARCSVKGVLTPAGKAAGTTPTAPFWIRAFFGKQPDGTWVFTQYDHDLSAG